MLIMITFVIEIIIFSTLAPKHVGLKYERVFKYQFA